MLTDCFNKEIKVGSKCYFDCCGKVRRGKIMVFDTEDVCVKNDFGNIYLVDHSLVAITNDEFEIPED